MRVAFAVRFSHDLFLFFCLDAKVIPVFIGIGWDKLLKLRVFLSCVSAMLQNYPPSQA